MCVCWHGSGFRVAVIAQAIWGMARSLTPDGTRAVIALAAIVIVVLFTGSFGQIAALVLGACAGLWFCRQQPVQISRYLDFPVPPWAGIISLVLFASLLLLPPLVVAATGSQTLALFDAFYRSGALVFGGGHVVLPLLQAQVVAPGWISNETFLAGYGVAQAVSGPLLTFSAYLGAVMGPAPNGIVGAIIALIALSLPGLLLVCGMLPFGDTLRAPDCAGCHVRGQCCCGGYSWRSPLHPGLDQCRP